MYWRNVGQTLIMEAHHIKMQWKLKKTFANQRVPIAKNDNVGLTGAVKRVLKRKNLSTSTIAARTRSRKKTYYTDSCPNTHKHEKENRTEKGLDIKKNC